MSKSFVIFSALYLPSAYGVERYTYNLASKLSQKGNKVKIITCNVFDLPFYEKDDNNVEVFRVPCIKLLNGRFPVIKFSSELRGLLKNISKEKIDLVVVNTRFYLSSLIGVIFSKKNNIKSIVIEHGTNHFSVQNRFWDSLGHIYEHFITFLIKRYCHNFYGVSKACNNWLKHFGIQANNTLYNSVNIDYINKIDYNKDYFCNKYHICSDDIIITFVGRLVKEKGILNLIQAFNMINSKENHVKLFVAGDGPLLSEVKNISKDNIFILGKIEFDDVIRLLKLSNIYCLPTEYSEGFPTSLLEAAASKSFIITTDKGGSKELIKSSEYGIILKNINPITIKESLELVINNEDYMKSAIEKSFIELINRFEWDNTSNMVIEIADKN